MEYILRKRYFILALFGITLLLGASSCANGTHRRLIHIKRKDFTSCAMIQHPSTNYELVFDKTSFIDFLEANKISDSISFVSASNLDTLDMSRYWERESILIDQFIEQNLSSGKFKVSKLQGNFVKRETHFIRSIKSSVNFKIKGVEIFYRRHAHVHF